MNRGETITGRSRVAQEQAILKEIVGMSNQTISLTDEEKVKDLLVRTVFGLWDIVNDLTRIRPSKRERYRVTIFGSARARWRSV